MYNLALIVVHGMFDFFFYGFSESILTASRTPSEWGIEFVNILIIAVTLVVVAVPEGVYRPVIRRDIC